MSNLPSWLQPIGELTNNLTATDLGEFAAKYRPDAKQAAVLILFAELEGSASLLFTQRSSNLVHHPSQIAFPGGEIDVTDLTASDAALREGLEEVNLNPESVYVIGELPKVEVAVSGYQVVPVLAYWEQPHQVFAANVDEVFDVFTVPIEQLVADSNRVWVRRGDKYKGPGFLINQRLIWGFTGTLLSVILEEAGLVSDLVNRKEVEVD